MTGSGGPVLARLAALPARPGGAPPARYALEVRPEQDPLEVAAAVRTRLAAAGAQVRALSALEPDVLLLELPDRSLDGAEPAEAFEAGHLLAEEFRLLTAEPDLPTAFFPELEPASAGPLVEEGLGGFPPGCWADHEPQLLETPRWALDRMHVPQAWAWSQERHRPSRGAGTVIAQIDTGTTPHAELQGGQTVPGFDTHDDDPDPTDPLPDSGNPGHGTATASVVVSPETLLVTGTAPAALHMPVRAIESVLRVRQVTVARAIDWAVEHGAHVITMSLGGVPTAALHRAVRRAVAADVIVLAAAGNCVRIVVWPARYEECIAVAGSNAADGPWSGTCRGAAVDITAPAQNVVRAFIPRGGGPGGSDVGLGQGTSFAVALTAGVAALWLAHHGRANLVQEARARGETLQRMFRRLVQASARRPQVWEPFDLGPGIVDARALLEADLDLGRDRETPSPPTDPVESAASSIAGLVAETAGPQAVPARLDWRRFGPELATVLLEQQLALAGTGPSPGTSPESPAPVIRPLSPQLAEAVSGTALASDLGLTADEPGPVPTGGAR